MDQDPHQVWGVNEIAAKLCGTMSTPLLPSQPMTRIFLKLTKQVHEVGASHDEQNEKTHDNEHE